MESRLKLNKMDIRDTGTVEICGIRFPEAAFNRQKEYHEGWTDEQVKLYMLDAAIRLGAVHETNEMTKKLEKWRQIKKE